MEQKKFEWPEFNSDKDRIKHNTQAYSQLSIADAFNSAYKLKIKPTEISDEVPRDLRVGDIIKVFIRDVQKNHVEFDSTNVKANLSSSVNLWKYNRFKNNIPKIKLSRLRPPPHRLREADNHPLMHTTSHNKHR